MILQQAGIAGQSQGQAQGILRWQLSRDLQAYVIICLAVFFGGSSLVAFLLFLLIGSPELIGLKFGASEVLWWDAGLSLTFFIQHSGMVRRPVRQRK
jgi:hypothetical protein